MLSNNIKNRLTNSKSIFNTQISDHVISYPTPVNLNYTYSFGSLSGIYFALQIITGVLLAMHYVPQSEFAFDSVVYIMQQIENGWLIRHIHVNGASMIFIVLYLHISRGLYFQSYLGSRSTLWWSGVIIFLLMMATAFIGYVLPWGQMSLWGATVITNFVTAVPYLGAKIVHWIWGGYSVSGITLTRFYSIHYMLPFIILGLVFAHLVLLHQVGSTNPTQVESKDFIRFHPYYTYKDLFALNFNLVFFILLIFFYPNLLGHSDNYIKANPLVTPSHIVPEWYFTPFYAILRACSSKLGGVLSMLLAILILLLFPLNGILKENNQNVCVKSFSHKIKYWIFVGVFLILMYIGGKPATNPYIALSRLFTVLYFVCCFDFVLNMTGKIDHFFYFSQTKNASVSLNVTEKNKL